jgi:hypothetical protein
MCSAIAELAYEADRKAGLFFFKIEQSPILKK